MKTIVLLAAILLSLSANSQSLLDALYSGKLKADTGAVIRKGDSLKIKENMAQKIIDDSVRKEALAIEKENAKVTIAKKDTTATGEDTTIYVRVDTAAINAAEAAAAAEKAAPKDNNKIWKTYMDELTNLVKSEVLTSNKLKKGAYSVLINYDINTDGQISVNSVSSDPQNSFLEQQITDRITLNSPKHNPVMGTNGKPRTVTGRKQILSFVK